MKQLIILGIVVAGVMIASAFITSQFPVETVLVQIEENRFVGALVFSLLMFIATVAAPLTMLPAVPIVAPFLGPFTTALAAIVGWLAGALVAFFIARYGGRPIIARFVDVHALESIESRIPENAHFLLLIALRLLFPVDVLSYALGLLSRVSVGVYAMTTFIGIIPFSFAFAYLGEAVSEHNYVLLFGIGVASAIVLGSALTYYRSNNQSRG